jgi:hypothetical protein
MFICTKCSREMLPTKDKFLYCVNLDCDFYGILSLAYVEVPGQEPKLLEDQR